MHNVERDRDDFALRNSESAVTDKQKLSYAGSERSDTNVGASSGNRLYLLIENPSKRNNLGPFLRCASAFGVEAFIFVGYATCSSHGAHGADKHVKTLAFSSFIQAIDFLRKPVEAGGCGIESVIGCLGSYDGDVAFQSSCMAIEKDAKVVPCYVLSQKNEAEDDSSKYPPSYPAHLRPFHNGSVCFVLSKYSFGLPIEQASFCDVFLHIPIKPTLYGADQQSQIGLLDAQTSLSIILHHWTAWNNSGVRKFSGQKFLVGTIDKVSTCDSSFKQKRAQRDLVKRSQIEVLDDTLSTESWSFLFGKEDS